MREDRFHMNIFTLPTYSRFQFTTDFPECHVLFNTIHSILKLDTGDVHIRYHRTLTRVWGEESKWELHFRFGWSLHTTAASLSTLSSPPSNVCVCVCSTNLCFRRWWRISKRQPRSQRQQTNIRSHFQALESRQLSLASALTSKSCRYIVEWVTHSECLRETFNYSIMRSGNSMDAHDHDEDLRFLSRDGKQITHRQWAGTREMAEDKLPFKLYTQLSLPNPWA